MPGPLARLGWAGVVWDGQVPGKHQSCSIGTHPREPQRKMCLGTVGQIVPEGSGTDLVENKEQ